MYTVYISADGFRIEAPLRTSVFYPTNEFVEVSVADAFTAASTYLTFQNGKRYKVILKLGFQESLKLNFLDGPPFTETKKAANKYVKDIIAAQQSA